MIYELEPLTQEEKEMVLKAPALITVLIAGADDAIVPQEINKAIELVNIKTFSEKLDLQPYYEEVAKTIEQDINDVIEALPGTAAERNSVISDELAKLNKVLARLKPAFSHDLYTSWKGFAHRVAQSWGGVLGINSISIHEKEWVDLPMLQEPKAGA